MELFDAEMCSIIIAKKQSTGHENIPLTKFNEVSVSQIHKFYLGVVVFPCSFNPFDARVGLGSPC